MGKGLNDSIAQGTGLRTRILLIAFVILLIANAGAISTSSYLFIERMLQAQQSRAEAIARGLDTQLQRLAALGIGINQLQGFEDQCRDVVINNEGLSTAMVIAPDGRVAFHNDPAQMGDARASREMLDAITAQRTLHADPQAQTYYALAPIAGDKSWSEGVIAIGFPFSLIDAQRDRLISRSVIVSVAAIALGMLLLVLALSRYVMRPISTIVKATESLRQSGNVASGGRLPESDLYEFGVMAQGINRLLDRVDQHEAALREAKDFAISANRAKTTFLANMSHELRTPMNAIMGFTDLALRKTLELQTRNYLEKMQVAEHGLLAIIDDVLDITRIESDNMLIKPGALELSKVIQSQIALIERAADDKRLRVTSDISPALVGRVLIGDAQRLAQVLLNLLSNAIKFTERGSVAVRASIEHDDTASHNVIVRIEVQDTGIGIASEDQKRLFQAFEQVDNSSTRAYGGTGLGLALSKRIVELMGGEVGLASTVGKGSTFWFTVRLVDGKSSRVGEPMPQQTIAADDKYRSRSAALHRVLLVEDDRVNQDVISEMLTDAGLEVEVAHHGGEALELIDPTVHALVIMDIQMPHMDGLEATRAMRNRADLAALPIIAMTANAFAENRDQCLQAGMNDFLTKPVDPTTFYRTLQRWLPR